MDDSPNETPLMSKLAASELEARRAEWDRIQQTVCLGKERNCKGADCWDAAFRLYHCDRDYYAGLCPCHELPERP